MANRHTKARAMRGKFNSSRIKSEMLADRGYYCEHCGNYDNVIELDHIKPLWAGGNNEMDNLQLLCWSCHFNKTRLERKAYKIMRPQKLVNDGVWINREKCLKAQSYKFEDVIKEIKDGTR